jgi:hypothetical protein
MLDADHQRVPRAGVAPYDSGPLASTFTLIAASTARGRADMGPAHRQEKPSITVAGDPCRYDCVILDAFASWA